MIVEKMAANVYKLYYKLSSTREDINTLMAEISKGINCYQQFKQQRLEESHAK